MFIRRDMMNRFAFVVVALSLLLGTLFAADSVSYANSNGLEVSRTLDVNKSGKINLIMNTAEYYYTSTLTLIIKNNGPIEKPGVVVAEALDFPTDAKITYSPEPVSVEGANGWNLGTIGAGQSVKIVAVVDSELSKEWLMGLPAPAISVEQIEAVLIAADIVNEGDSVKLTLTTEQAVPIAGAKITAISPSGNKLEMMTDSSGSTDYRATEAGSYLYVVDGYRVSSTPETQVKALIKSPPITASIREGTPAASEGVLSQFTMVIAGFMVVSLILLAVIAYYSMKEEPESNGRKRNEDDYDEEEAAPVSREYDETAKKSVNSFRDEAARIERAKEMTRKILEARKKELAAKGKKKK